MCSLWGLDAAFALSGADKWIKNFAIFTSSVQFVSLVKLVKIKMLWGPDTSHRFTLTICTAVSIWDHSCLNRSWRERTDWSFCFCTLIGQIKDFIRVIITPVLKCVAAEVLIFSALSLLKMINRRTYLHKTRPRHAATWLVQTNGGSDFTHIYWRGMCLWNCEVLTRNYSVLAVM